MSQTIGERMVNLCTSSLGQTLRGTQALSRSSCQVVSLQYYLCPRIFNAQGRGCGWATLKVCWGLGEGERGKAPRLPLRVGQ
jgi:hypothetical protein